MYTMCMAKRWTDRQTGIATDCTYIKTINILSTVSIDKKKEKKKKLPG